MGRHGGNHWITWEREVYIVSVQQDRDMSLIPSFADVPFATTAAPAR
jgi:hypothetical protein